MWRKRCFNAIIVCFGRPEVTRSLQRINKSFSGFFGYFFVLHALFTAENAIDWALSTKKERRKKQKTVQLFAFASEKIKILVWTVAEQMRLENGEYMHTCLNTFE